MLTQYWRDIVDIGVVQACQMPNLVAGSHDVIHYSSYRTACAALNTRIAL